MKKLTLSACMVKEPTEFLPENSLAIRDKQRLWFIDGTEKTEFPPLLVAHVDTVQEPKFHGTSRDSKYIFASGLDDRLGVYLALLVQRARPFVDILFCDEEEKVNSSAAQVKADELKKYGCVLELDRSGMDFVDYDLSNSALRSIVKDHYDFARGSYSDICALPENVCAMVNLGIGYMDSHSFGSYVAVSDMRLAYKRILAIVDKVTGTHFSAPKPKFTRYKAESWPGKLYDYHATDYAGYSTQEDFDELTASGYGPSLECIACGIDLATGYERREGLCLDCMLAEREALKK